MSAGQSTERYKVVRVVTHFPLYRVVDNGAEFPAPYFIDCYSSESAAAYAARSLNAGVAHVDRHAVVGCKVVAS